MKGGLILGILLSAAIHAAMLLFGGLPFGHAVDHGSLQQVELVAEEEVKQEEKKEEEQPEEAKEELEAVEDEPPEAAEIVQRADLSAAQSSPELEAASLSAIDAALSGATGPGGDFADSVSFASGGRIGGVGKPGASGAGGLDREFNLSEIDQKPRAINQSPPVYPASQRKVEGVVTVIFIVDPSGRVSKARVEKSTHPDFEQPALEAVKKWKFEPALKGGERVACKMRVPIRFQPK